MNTFILFEGISGSGKSTLAQMLYEALEERNVPCVLNTEPTPWSPLGESIRMIIEGRFKDDPVSRDSFFEETDFFMNEIARQSGKWDVTKAYLDTLRRGILRLKEGGTLNEEELQYLYILDRYQDVKTFILPAIGRGKGVIQDRYDWSTFAYGASRGLSVRKLHDVHEHALGELYLVPDITFYIRARPQVAMERLKRSGKKIDRFEEKMESMKAIADAYDETERFMNYESNNVVVLDGEKPLEIVFKDVLEEYSLE